MCRTGELVAVKRNRKWLITDTALTQWVRNNTYMP